MSTNLFAMACAEYRYLREKGYPEKATLKLVGDRHRLTRAQRNSMFRGIVVDALAAPRRRKIVLPADVPGSSLGIDWYNVLITVESYLRGSPVFISDDGIVRDSSATHGSYRSSELTARAFQEIVGQLKAMAPSAVDVFLDAPIAFSGLMAEEVRRRLDELPCPTQVSVAHSADYPLKAYEGIVASSDSVILDSAPRILDLPRAVMQRSFRFIPPLLHDLYSFSP
ncbi:MAG: DUF434 domain-containing protein [Spirochaetia bacterium]